MYSRLYSHVQDAFQQRVAGAEPHAGEPVGLAGGGRTTPKHQCLRDCADAADAATGTYAPATPDSESTDASSHSANSRTRAHTCIAHPRKLPRGGQGSLPWDGGGRGGV